MNALTAARWLTLGGYFALLGLITARVAFLAPPQHLPRAAVLILLLAPLLAPLRGLLHARPYTHAWASFLALGYFMLGIWHAAAPEERGYGIALVAASLAFFLGTLAYVRLEARAGRPPSGTDNAG